LNPRLRSLVRLVRLAAVVLTATAIPSARVLAEVPPDVHLAATSATSIGIEVTMPAATFEVGATGMTRLSLAGYGMDGEVGSPALPVRILTVAVPPLGDVRLRAVGLDADVREGMLLAPVPGPDPADLNLPPIEARSAAAYARREAGETPRARLLGVSWMRNQRVARIAVLPAAYDAPARRLSLARSIRIDVEVTPSGDLGAPAEAQDPFENVYRDVLVNYEQGRAWRRPSTRNLLRGAGTSAFAVAGVSDVIDTTNVYAGRPWVRIAVDRAGFYKVSFDQVRNLDLFQNTTGQDLSTTLNEVRLFSWKGVPVMPTDTYCDSCGYSEVAIGWSDDGDGLFNKNADYFYFFAMGASDWTSLYSPAEPETVFLDQPYSAQNYCYLTRTTNRPPSDPLVIAPPHRIANLDGRLVGDEAEIATFPARTHFEQDNEYWPDASPQIDLRYGSQFWEKWFWRSRTQGEQFTQTLSLPGADTTQASRMRVRTWGLSSNLALPPGYVRSIPDHFLDLTINNVSLPERVFYDIQPADFDTTLAGGDLRPSNSFKMLIRSVSDPLNALRVDRTGLAWIEFYYARRFEPVSDELAFDSPPGGGTFVYRIGPFTDPNPPELYDVTDVLTPQRVTFAGSQYEPVTGGYRLSVRLSDAGRHRYRVTSSARIGKLPGSNLIDAPGAITNYENYRSTFETADYIVIYYDGFKSAADTLADWRREHLPLPGRSAPYAVKTVPISALYDQFSGGRTDPAAIRNFLRVAFFNWNRDPFSLVQSRHPTFVTLLGDASYDFKNITGRAHPGQPGTLLPSFENGFDRGVHRQFATDDWLLNVDNPVEIVPDFFGGRIPVDDPATALDVVRNKVLLYERTVPLGEYRNKVMLIADDNEQGAAVDPIGWGHLAQTTRIDSTYTPAHIDRAYVYLHTYPDGTGETKPGAKLDIMQNINTGVTMFNYIGHGSPFKIADESVLLDGDVQFMVNAPRFPVFVAASCDVGKFNDPNLTSLGELLITRSGGGAIAVISATELAFSFQNEELNQILYRAIFRRDTLECAYHVTLAEALLAAKSGSTNNQKYQLMGDAATRLHLPNLWTEITLEPDTGSAPLTEIRRGQTVRFRGRVLDCPGGAPVPMNGVASMLIEDSQPLLAVPGCLSPLACTDYYFTAGAIYRGDVEVTNGDFSGRFVVPMEARQGARGRVRAYVQGHVPGLTVETDGVGAVPSQVSAGTPDVADLEGPRITLSFTGGATSVRPTAELRVDLFDPSGILTTGHTPQNGIVVTVDGNAATRVDITSSFRYAAESFQSGTATFRLKQLAPGPHHIDVSAADNMASGLSAAIHRSTAGIDFIVVETPPLQIKRAYLFPNPAVSGPSTGGGQFVVDVPGDSVNVLLRVYTASGRLIRTLNAFGGIGQVQIAWDGLDAEGAALANGVYFFSVHVNTREADGSSSARQRDDLQGRFVILNRK
jgi:Peptidase family C25/FlgD Ig-like domain